MSAASRKSIYGQSPEATASDLAAVAAGGWEAPSWKTDAREYHEAGEHSGGKPPKPSDPQLERRSGHAASMTVEALMMGLRERGIAALTEPKVRRRL
jgi:hypothetical protein